MAPESEVKVMRGWYTVKTRYPVVSACIGVGVGVGVEVGVGVGVGFEVRVGVGVGVKKWCVSGCDVGG